MSPENEPKFSCEVADKEAGHHLALLASTATCLHCGLDKFFKFPNTQEVEYAWSAGGPQEYTEVLADTRTHYLVQSAVCVHLRAFALAAPLRGQPR